MGSRIHHSFGVWPVLIDDETSILEWDAPRRAVIKPAGWPLGEAKVTIEVRRVADGSLIRLTEEAIRGPGALVPRVLLDPLLHLRNVETLRRLVMIAEGKHADRSTVVTGH